MTRNTCHISAGSAAAGTGHRGWGGQEEGGRGRGQELAQLGPGRCQPPVWGQGEVTLSLYSVMMLCYCHVTVMMSCYCQGPDHPGAALGHAGRPLDWAAGRRGLGGEELPSTDTRILILILRYRYCIFLVPLRCHRPHVSLQPVGAGAP